MPADTTFFERTALELGGLDRGFRSCALSSGRESGSVILVAVLLELAQ